MDLQSVSGQSSNTTIESSLHAKVVEGRDFFNELGKSYPPSASVEVRHDIINDVSCYWFTPKQPHANKLMICLHGGGYVWGSIQSHEAFVSHLAEQTGTAVLFVEYALAPENPYPKGLLDVINVYNQIVNQFPGTEIFLVGDSAGGGLVVSAIGRLQKEQRRQPNGVVLISPWLNLNADSPSYTHNASLDPILTLPEMEEFVQAYNPNSLPGANPCAIAFEHFPPVLIVVGTHEILLDDSQLFYDRIGKIQKNASFHIFPRQIHGWMLVNIDDADSRSFLTEIKAFLTQEAGGYLKN